MPLGPGGEYYMAFNDGAEDYGGLPPSCETEVQNGRGDVEIENISFGPDGSWCIQWDDGTWSHEKLPEPLVKKLGEHPQAVSIGGASSSRLCWGIAWDDAPYKVGGGFPTRLINRMDKIGARNGKINEVEFGSCGDWVIRYTQAHLERVGKAPAPDPANCKVQ